MHFCTSMRLATSISWIAASLGLHYYHLERQGSNLFQLPRFRGLSCWNKWKLAFQVGTRLHSIPSEQKLAFQCISFKETIIKDQWGVPLTVYPRGTSNYPLKSIKNVLSQNHTLQQEPCHQRYEQCSSWSEKNMLHSSHLC